MQNRFLGSVLFEKCIVFIHISSLLNGNSLKKYLNYCLYCGYVSYNIIILPYFVISVYFCVLFFFFSWCPTLVFQIFKNGVAKTSENVSNHNKSAFLPMANNFKVAQFLSNNCFLNFPNLGAFEPLNNQNNPIEWKKNCIYLLCEVDNQYWLLSILIPQNWWKKMFLDIEKTQQCPVLTENWQIWRNKGCRRQTDESSSILGHPPNNFLTSSRQFQSSPIQQETTSVGNTVQVLLFLFNLFLYVTRYSKRYLKSAPTCVWFPETNQ